MPAAGWSGSPCPAASGPAASPASSPRRPSRCRPTDGGSWWGRARPPPGCAGLRARWCPRMASPPARWSSISMTRGTAWWPPPTGTSGWTAVASGAATPSMAPASSRYSVAAPSWCPRTGRGTSRGWSRHRQGPGRRHRRRAGRAPPRRRPGVRRGRGWLLAALAALDGPPSGARSGRRRHHPCCAGLARDPPRRAPPPTMSKARVPRASSSPIAGSRWVPGAMSPGSSGPPPGGKGSAVSAPETSARARLSWVTAPGSGPSSRGRTPSGPADATAACAAGTARVAAGVLRARSSGPAAPARAPRRPHRRWRHGGAAPGAAARWRPHRRPGPRRGAVDRPGLAAGTPDDRDGGRRWRPPHLGASASARS